MKWVSFGIVFGIGLNPYLFPIEEKEGKISKNEMECPASMANHMQKNLGHTLSRVSTSSTGKDRFQDVHRHKARYRFWDCIVFSRKMQIVHF